MSITHSLQPSPEDATPSSQLRIVVADGHFVVREGVKALVELQTDMCVVGEAEGGTQVVEIVRALSAQDATPDLVVMDVSLSGGGDIETTAQIRRLWSTVKILSFSIDEDHSYIRSVLEAGADGFVFKRSPLNELIHAIRTIAKGGFYFDPSFATEM